MKTRIADFVQAGRHDKLEDQSYAAVVWELGNMNNQQLEEWKWWVSGIFEVTAFNSLDRLSKTTISLLESAAQQKLKLVTSRTYV